jgi:hypothetical protein
MSYIDTTVKQTKNTYIPFYCMACLILGAYNMKLNFFLSKAYMGYFSLVNKI